MLEDITQPLQLVVEAQQMSVVWPSYLFQRRATQISDVPWHSLRTATADISPNAFLPSRGTGGESPLASQVFSPQHSALAVIVSKQPPCLCLWLGKVISYWCLSWHPGLLHVADLVLILSILQTFQVMQIYIVNMLISWGYSMTDESSLHFDFIFLCVYAYMCYI